MTTEQDNQQPMTTEEWQALNMHTPDDGYRADPSKQVSYEEGKTTHAISKGYEEHEEEVFVNSETSLKIRLNADGTFEVQIWKHSGHRTYAELVPLDLPIGKWVAIPSNATGRYVRSCEAMFDGTDINLRVNHGNCYTVGGGEDCLYTMVIQ